MIEIQLKQCDIVSRFGKDKSQINILYHTPNLLSNTNHLYKPAIKLAVFMKEQDDYLILLLHKDNHHETLTWNGDRMSS